MTHTFPGADPSVRENIDQSLMMVIDQESKYQRRSPYNAALRAGVSSSIPSSVTVITSSGDL